MDRDSGRGGARGIGRLPAGGCRKSPKRKRAGWGCSLLSKRKGVQVFSAVRTQKTKINTCGLLKPHKLYQQNVLRSLKGFSDIFYFIVYFKVVFKTKHTETKPRNGLAVCSQKYKHYAVCASRAALKTITKNWNHKIKWLSYEVLEKQIFFIFKCKFKYFPFSSRSSKTNLAAQKKKKERKKKKQRKETNIIKIHISIKGQTQGQR